MSKKKSQQRKKNTQKRAAAARHDHQVAVETKHQTETLDWKNIIVLFLIYLGVFLLITALIDWWVGDVFDAPLVYLIPLAAAAVMTFVHYSQRWRMPRL